MAYIETIPPEDADGVLKEVYDLGIRRDGRVAAILRVMSQHGEALSDLMRLYMTIAYGPSGLSRAQREMIAVAVSKANGCHY